MFTEADVRLLWGPLNTGFTIILTPRVFPLVATTHVAVARLKYFLTNLTPSLN